MHLPPARERKIKFATAERDFISLLCLDGQGIRRGNINAANFGITNHRGGLKSSNPAERGERLGRLNSVPWANIHSVHSREGGKEAGGGIKGGGVQSAQDRRNDHSFLVQIKTHRLQQPIAF